MDQFGRALSELNIDIICANSSQAKGRVERANKTLQDRLVKELRLKGISSQEAANAFMPEFIEAYNRRFAKPPAKSADLHRPLLDVDQGKLHDIFAWQEKRVVSNSLTVQYDKVMYIIEDTVENRKLRRQKIKVFDWHNGDIKLYSDGHEINYIKKFDKLRTVEAGDIVENKSLSHILGIIKDEQSSKEITRSQSMPSRSITGDYNHRLKIAKRKEVIVASPAQFK